MRKFLSALLLLACLSFPACKFELPARLRLLVEQLSPVEPAPEMPAPVAAKPARVEAARAAVGAADRLVIPALKDVPPDRMREFLRDAYRLKPDARCLSAVSEMAALLTGTAPEPVAARYEGGEWVVASGAVEVGRLPEFPDFGDMLALLRNWAAYLEERYPFTLVPATAEDLSWVEGARKQIGHFWANHLIQFINQADKRWAVNRGSSAVLEAVTRAWVRLAVQQLDRLELEPAVAGRALALLVLAETHRLGDFTRERILLSMTMGYSGYSRRTGLELPADDPYRLFLEKKTGDLRRLARETGASGELKYLWLLREGQEMEDGEGWWSELDKYLSEDRISMGPLSLALSMNDFGFNRDLAPVLPYLVIYDLMHISTERPPGDTEDSGLAAWTTEFLRKIGEKVRKEQEKSTPFHAFMNLSNPIRADTEDYFLPGRLLVAWYESAFYSAIYLNGRFYSHQLSSEEGAREFFNELPVDLPGRPADYRRWYEATILAEERKLKPEKFRQQLEIRDGLGREPTESLLDAAEEAIPYNDLLRQDLVKLYAMRLDSRPRHRRELGNSILDWLYDLPLAERLFASAIRTDPESSELIAAWFASFTGDTARLWSVLDDPVMRLDNRIKALEYLGKLKETGDLRLRNEYRKLIGQQPSRWDIRADYIDYLEDRQKDYWEMERVASDWLDRYGELQRDTFEFIFARTAYARALHKQGRPDRAYEIIEPEIESYQAGAMMRASLILLELKRYPEAEDVARRMYDRYPTRLPLELMEIKWVQKDYAGAAAALAAYRAPMISSEAYWKVGKLFARVFEHRPSSEATEAFRALVADPGQQQGQLIQIPNHVGAHGRPELAVNLYELVPYDVRHVPYRNLLQYGLMRKYRGAEDSLRWISERFPAELRRRAGQLEYFSYGTYNLLWELSPEYSPGVERDFHWLLKAASVLVDPDIARVHKPGVEDYYRTAKGASYYHETGRYLAGLIPEAQVVGLMDTPKKRCELAYYLGLKAEAEGRYEEASDWYRISMETRMTNNGEWDWSLDQLAEWYRTGHSLSYIRRNPELLDEPPAE